MFLGLVVSAVLGYSTMRLSLCLVRTHRVTPSLVLATAFRVFAFIYLVRWGPFLDFPSPFSCVLVFELASDS